MPTQLVAGVQIHHAVRLSGVRLFPVSMVISHRDVLSRKLGEIRDKGSGQIFCPFGLRYSIFCLVLINLFIEGKRISSYVFLGRN